MILAEIFAECSLERFFYYLVMTIADMQGLVTFAKILQRKDAQGHPEQIEVMKLSLFHWILCSLVCFLGLVVGIDSTQPLYYGRQLISKFARFWTPNQLADFKLSEMEA